MVILNYASKKELKAAVGQKLKYFETSIFGDEYKEDGTLWGCNRPHITGFKREFFAEIEMKDGLVKSVK